MKKRNSGWCACGCVGLLGLVAVPCLLPVLLVVMVAGVAQSLVTASLDLLPHPLPSHVPQGPHGPAIAQAAIDVGKHLYGLPDNHYTAAAIPAETLRYWQTACLPGSSCWASWQSGNLQCVLFVMGAFALAHARGQADMMPVSGNAVDYAALYAHRPGWQEILPGQGFPQIGDAVVWSGDRYGHIALVVGVHLPQGNRNGSVTIAQANGPAAFELFPLRPDGTIDTLQWRNGYQQLAYIRDV